MASNSRSRSTAPSGRTSPVFRYLSPPKSNRSSEYSKPFFFATASSTLSPSATTSGPVPSPPSTAIFSISLSFPPYPYPFPIPLPAPAPDSAPSSHPPPLPSGFLFLPLLFGRFLPLPPPVVVLLLEARRVLLFVAPGPDVQIRRLLQVLLEALRDGRVLHEEQLRELPVRLRHELPVRFLGLQLDPGARDARELDRHGSVV